MQDIYKIKRAFIIPLFTIVALLFLLFLISIFKGQMWENVILFLMFFITLLVGIEAFRREIIINDNDLTIKKFFRSKKFSWAEITQLAVVALKKKAYFLLTTTKGFYIFSNLFENHSLLINTLVNRLSEEKVEIEVKNYLNNPVERLSLIVMSWIAVLTIGAVIILKVAGT
jgi:hypothetical protein